MPEPKFAILAGNIERAKCLFRQLAFERGHDMAFGVSKWGAGARGYDFDVILIDETALPLSPHTWASYAPSLRARNGQAYTLRSMGAADIKE